jgi:hypothetical protein
LIAFNYGSLRWTGNVYRYNITQNNGTHTGINVAGEMCVGSIPSGGTCEIYGNTFYSNSTTRGCAVYVPSGGSTSGTTYVANNIFYSNMTNTTAYVNISGGTWTFTGNNYYGNSSGRWIWGSTYTTFASWRSAREATGHNVNPELSNPGNAPSGIGYNPAVMSDYYQVKPSSPMIDAGINLVTTYGWNVGTRDYFGNSIPDASGNYSIGACQNPLS